MTRKCVRRRAIVWWGVEEGGELTTTKGQRAEGGFRKWAKFERWSLEVCCCDKKATD